MDNQLSGEIPAELSRLSNLTVLWLYDNQLSGEIPAELSRLSNLYTLRLDRNTEMWRPHELRISGVATGHREKIWCCQLREVGPRADGPVIERHQYCEEPQCEINRT